jgi:hypothetical protein
MLCTHLTQYRSQRHTSKLVKVMGNTGTMEENRAGPCHPGKYATDRQSREAFPLPQDEVGEEVMAVMEENNRLKNVVLQFLPMWSCMPLPWMTKSLHRVRRLSLSKMSKLTQPRMTLSWLLFFHC